MLWRIREKSKRLYSIRRKRKLKNITATLLKLDDFFDNLSGKLEYETSVSIKSDEDTPYAV